MEYPKLKKVIFNIEHHNQKTIKQDIVSFIGRLQEEGIDVKTYDRFAQCDLSFENNEENQSVLFITDSQERAVRAREQGYAVWIYQNEANRDLSFSEFRFFVEGFEEVTPFYAERIFRRCQGIPWIITETERLIIREAALADLDAIYHLYEDKKVTRYMEDLYENREEEAEYLRNYIEVMYGVMEYGTWLMERKEDGKVIGRVGFNKRDDFDALELGFMVAAPFWKYGYAYEACSAVIAYAWENLEQSDLYALVKEENDAACKLCEKLGFYRIQTVMVQEEELLQYCLQFPKQRV